MIRKGEREIGAVHETVMPFLKPDVKKKSRILLFTVFFLSDFVTHRQ